MDWPENIAANWPAPREDEPASLRQDIVDELADHLDCSMSRERHVTTDAKLAKRNVLDRFGDPAKIARKLWLDEMWEKIMLQRATLAVTTILAAAAVAACVLLAMVLEQNRTVNAAILQKLTNASAPAAELKSLEWNPVKVRLVAGKPGGPPVEGFRVSLQGNIVGDTGFGNVTETTDKNGLADFGLLRPAYYTLVTTTSWSEESMTTKLTVRPGTTEPFEIVCPAGPRKTAVVTITVDWPDELKDKNLWLIADFVTDGRKVDQGYWSLPYGKPMMGASRYSGVGGGGAVPGGRTLFLGPNDNQALFTYPAGGQNHGLPRIESKRLVFLHGVSTNLKKSQPWPEGTSRLMAIGVVQATTVKREGVPEETLSGRGGDQYWFGSGNGMGMPGSSGMATYGGMEVGPMGGTSPPEAPLPAPTFHAVAGKPNHWKIQLPESLVKKVKKRLAPFKDSGGNG